MNNSNTILVHTGLRQGELIIGHADGSDTVFLPPLNYAYRFTIVKNSDIDEWAISRTQLSNGTIEALLKFTSLESAENALTELHQALLEPAPEPVTPVKERSIKFTDLPLRTIAIITAFAVAIGVILFMGIVSQNDNSDDGQAMLTQDTPAPSSAAETETYISPTAPPAPMPASPGEALLLQIGGGAQAPGPSQPSPVQQPITPQAPPGTPGDGLLQQIQGR